VWGVWGVWGVWVSLPPATQQQVVSALGADPHTWLLILSAAAVIVARLVKQPPLGSR
jgi:hypothetical protein